MKKPDRDVPTHHHSQFTWLRTPDGGSRAVGFASDLAEVGGRVCGCVWSDAADVGFYVQGKREAHLYLLSDSVDGADTYVNVDLVGHELVIFNT